MKPPLPLPGESTHMAPPHPRKYTDTARSPASYITGCGGGDKGGSDASNSESGNALLQWKKVARCPALYQCVNRQKISLCRPLLVFKGNAAQKTDT